MSGSVSPVSCGGGAYFGVGTEATLTGNLISGNRATERGGGIFVFSHRKAVLNSNTITDNITDGRGGGVYILGSSSESSDAMMNGNIISGNTAQSEGGGLSLAIRDGSAMLTNNVIADNQATSRGSGVYVEAPANLLHTTIARNSGGNGTGIYVASGWGAHGSVVLTNTIMASQQTGIKVASGCTVTVNSVLWYDTPVTISQEAGTTVVVQNQHTGDPTFAADGYHLTEGSAAIDVGVNGGVGTDIDDAIRPQASGFDLGVDEFWPTLTANYTSGKPGSFFTLAGSNFPPNSIATIVINGTMLTDTLAVGGSGSFVFLLDTSQADVGRYFVTATVNPSATADFTLNPNAPLRLQEGTGPILNVPSGIAFTEFVYLPLVCR